MALALLQAAGAVTVLPYPFLLFFSLLAEPATAPSAAAFLLRALFWTYPVLWAALWAGSWLLLRRGRTAAAVLLSTPPALALLAAIGWGVAVSALDRRYWQATVSRDVAEASAGNPLVGDLIALDYGEKKWPEVQRAIEAADPALLAKPAGKWGTPLRFAIAASSLVTMRELGRARPDLLAAARLLLARGARLSPSEEAGDVGIAWAADVLRRGRPLPDPEAARENPMVWRIMTAGVEDDLFHEPTLDEMRRRHPELLDRPTTTYGTPLHAARVRNFRSVVAVLEPDR